MLHGSRLQDVTVAALLLEELLEMVFAVEHAFQCRVVGWRNCTPTVRAPEAGLVIRLFFYCDLPCPSTSVLSISHHTIN